jgi:hypothetical protein
MLYVVGRKLKFTREGTSTLDVAENFAASLEPEPENFQVQITSQLLVFLSNAANIYIRSKKCHKIILIENI